MASFALNLRMAAGEGKGSRYWSGCDFALRYDLALL